MTELPIQSEDSKLDLITVISALNALFERYPKEDRILVPLFVVLDILFDASVLQMVEPCTAYSAQLLCTFKKVKEAVYKCRDAKKLLAAIKV